MRCKYCGRELKDAESEARGCGSVCAGKHKWDKERQSTIFEIKEEEGKDGPAKVSDSSELQ